MPPVLPRFSRARIALAYIAVWTVLALFFATKYYMAWTSNGMKTTWTKHLWWQAMEWYSWAALALLVFRCCRRLEHVAGLRRHLMIQLGLAVAFALVHVLILTGGTIIEAAVLHTGRTPFELVRIVFINHFHSDMFTYGVIVSCWHAVNYFRKFSEREVKTAELEKRLAEARLQALTNQLQPHFLFNTLNSVSALNHDDPKAANRMLARLSELLRLSMEPGTEQEIPLRRELEFLAAYLEIEQTRLGDRLHIDFEVAPDTLDAMVPRLLLQPLVENAIRHGIAPFTAPGRVLIRVQRNNGSLEIAVSDTGPGFAPAGTAKRAGIGLENTRVRLEQLYAAGQQLVLSNGNPRGANVHVRIPFVMPEATP